MTAAALSYVVVTDRFDTVRGVVAAVAGQSIAHLIELVLVAPPGVGAVEAEATRSLHGVRLVEVGSIAPVAGAYAAGIRAASAELVYVGETHSFPEPDCMERLLARHGAGNHPVVMPRVVNANPRRASSWANFLLTYGAWAEPVSGPIRTASIHNGCFRRAPLVAHGDRLPALLVFGSELHDEVTRGDGAVLEPAAVVAHVSVAALGAGLDDLLLGARIHAGLRARRWSRARRLVYAAASPLVPAVVVARLLRTPQWRRHRRVVPRGTVACLVASACAIALGEALGYLAGEGSAPVRIAKYELFRTRYA